MSKRRYKNTSPERSLSQRLGSENIMSDGMLFPIDSTEQAIFQMTPKENKGKNR
ncbi:hypothetical protein [Natronincola ferrireducens]|uniref:Uncharacterized protein n=1 Tax=Natronincola ferrireducens TaxID=393762 RepID=A0A1G8XVA9_9FIRM|nr:hypothetical protein [Natronincola ferrireducens]SDJ93825.1 hypothetical protein SAMN05660472_00323 [Natronincola ferrireducens]